MNENMNRTPAPLPSTQLIWQPFWRLSAWLLVVLVVILSVVPTGVPAGFEGGDKLQHLLAYMVLGFWFAVLYPRERRLILLGLILLGAALEAVQGLVPARMASPFDLLADALGVFLGVLLARSPAQGLFGWVERRLAAGVGHSQS
ncbi:putative integral membrane protein [Thiorhodovibrio litoralis]|nr:putative integral membrane protein [Thiorhodovibrio litoralis]